MVSKIANNSAQEGRPTSRLPTFSKDWIDKIRGSADFLGLNYYTSRYVAEYAVPTGQNPSNDRDLNLEHIVKPEFKASVLHWLYSYPKGLGQLLRYGIRTVEKQIINVDNFFKKSDLVRWIKKEYANPTVLVTENGWVDNGEMQDDGRIEYIHDHLQEIQNAILNDRCNVKGYIAWSLIDTFEWAQCYTKHFGFYAVNMSSSRRERTPKKSVEFMKKLAFTHQIPKIH